METKQTLLDEYIKKVEGIQKTQMRKALRSYYLVGTLFILLLGCDFLLFRWANNLNLNYTADQIFLACIILSVLCFVFMLTLVSMHVRSIKTGMEIISQFKQHLETFQENLAQIKDSEMVLKRLQDSVRVVLKALGGTAVGYDESSLSDKKTNR